MSKDKLTIETPDWQFFCADNAEDILLNISGELAGGFHEALSNYQEVTISDIGQRIGLDLEQQRNESMSVTQRVIDTYTAASVLVIIPQINHETDRGQWEGNTWQTRNGANLPDLPKMVEAMAISTLENVVGHFMAECFEECWEDLQHWWESGPSDAKSEDGAPSLEAVEKKFIELVQAWEYEKLV